MHRPDLVTACLLSLSKQTLPHAEFEVVVVENQAQQHDPAPEIPAGVETRRIFLKENWGTTASINHALTLGDSTYVFLLNNDVELEQDFLHVLVTALEADPVIGFATPKLLKASDRSHLDGAGDALLLGGGAYRLGHSDPDRGQFDIAREVLAGCGAATMFRRAMIADTRGLDEDFFAYLEDVDLALRGQLLGWKGTYVPSAIGYHIGSATLGDAVHPRIIQLLTRNQILLVIKNYPAALLLRLGTPILMFQLLWMAFAMKRGALSAYLKGFAGAFYLLPRTVRKRRLLMTQKRVSNRELLRILRSSEEQISCWHFGRKPEHRSRLLETYFMLFGPREGARQGPPNSAA